MERDTSRGRSTVACRFYSQIGADSPLSVRGGVAMRKSAKHSLFANNLQSVMLCIMKFCHDIDIFAFQCLS